jgi:hypothetical protein
MYFENFPTIKYLLEPATRGSSDISVLLTDITKNVRFKKEIIDNITLYDFYFMKEGDTYEVISEKLYGTPAYHWILMLINDAYDWRSGIPLVTRTFNDYIIDKYGSVAAAQAQIHHYVNSKGFVVDQNNLNENNQLDASPVTTYKWEEDLNESKRKIKVVSLEMIDTIAKNFKDLM